MHLRTLLTVASLLASAACEKSTPANGDSATAASASSSPSAAPSAASAAPSASAGASTYDAGDKIELDKIAKDNAFRAILEAAADSGPHVTPASLLNAPVTPLSGTYNGATKFEKMLIECTDKGYQARLTPQKDGDKYFIVFPLDKEPTVGVKLSEPTQMPTATLTIDGVTWHLKHSWAIHFKQYKATPFKGKEAVLGHASGTLIWVPFSDSGLKITQVAGTFGDAPIKALGNCKPQP